MPAYEQWLFVIQKSHRGFQEKIGSHNMKAIIAVMSLLIDNTVEITEDCSSTSMSP